VQSRQEHGEKEPHDAHAPHELRLVNSQELHDGAGQDWQLMKLAILMQILLKESTIQLHSQQKKETTAVIGIIIMFQIQFKNASIAFRKNFRQSGSGLRATENP
jgi:hypothetical protein